MTSLILSTSLGLGQSEKDHGGDPVCGWGRACVDRGHQISAVCESAELFAHPDS